MTEYLLPTILGTEPQQRMQRALKIGTEVDWVRAAERIISGKVAGADWHLEDPDANTINDDDWQDSPAYNPLALDALHLLESPQADLPISGVGGIGRRQTRRQQMGITSRHMGLAGQGAWFLDNLDGNGCPHAILYIRPDRLTPDCTDSGLLKSWLLDKRPGDPGTPLDPESVVLFQLQMPDTGIFAPGLIESSMAKALNNGLIDRHYSALLASGGRISGILMPKEGRIDDDTLYNQLVKDWRNITEQPEAARRLQIVRAPVEFTSTVQSVGEMQIIDLMYHNRDALLALWGVPLSMLGGSTSSGGLNSGETRKYDEAALWQGAVHDRLVEIRENIQNAILDRWEDAIGWAPTLIFDEPEFDDDEPSFKKVQLSAGLPMRNSERRAIVGLDPFGDEALDNQIVLPVTFVEFGMAPNPDTGEIPESDLEDETPAPILIQSADGGVIPAQAGGVAAPAANVPPAPPKGITPAALAPSAMAAQRAAGKASLTAPRRGHDIGAVRLREQMQRHVEPHVKSAVHNALQDQRREVSRLIERNWETIKRHGPADESLWWPSASHQDKLLVDALEPALAGMAEVVHDHIRDALDTPAIE
jgi:hypothetical protein